MVDVLTDKFNMQNEAADHINAMPQADISLHLSSQFSDIPCAIIEEIDAAQLPIKSEFCLDKTTELEPILCNGLKHIKPEDLKHEHCSEEKPLKCEKCDFHTSDKCDLMIHSAIHPVYEYVPLRCEKCDFSTMWHQDMKLHQMWHRGEEPYPCSYCRYCTTSKARSEKHEKTHTLPYRCNMCNFRSSSRKYLRTHILSHSDEKRFKCSLCGYETVQEMEFQLHEKSHLTERHLKCQYCKYTTLRKCNLQLHIAIHTNEQMSEVEKISL